MKYEIAILSIQRFPFSDSKSLDITPQLNAIKEKDIRIIILYCSITISKTVINQADRMNMFRSGWTWLVMDSITSYSFKYLSDDDGYVLSSLVGLIGTAFVVPDTILYLNLVNQLKKKSLRNQLENQQAFTRVYDAVLAIANGLHKILYEERVSFELPTFQKGSCADSVNQWKWGRNLLESILNLNNVNGSLGPLKFTKYGYHHLNSFDIKNLQVKGFVKVGKWLGNEKNLTINSEIIFPGQTVKPPDDSHHSLYGKTLNIGTVIDEPFIMKNPYYKEGDPITSKYEGLLIDLLLKLQEMHDFEFKLHETKQYGNKNEETKEWNGLVRQLMDKKIDLALAPLTISWKRQEVISFTAPYYDLGLTILMPKYNAKTTENYFAFLSPFEATVWFTIAVSVIFTSLVLAICVNLTPTNFNNKRKERTKTSQNVGDSSWFTFPQALWWSFSSLVAPGTELEQKSNLPARIVMLTWWLTTVILIAAYTAKLAAFMTVQNMKQEINSLEDLVNFNTIPFGVLKDSYVENFFANSHYEIHKIAYRMMRKHNTFINDTNLGIERVRASYYLPEGHKDRFALISDSPLLDYSSTQRPCNVERVGRLFGLQNYGFGLPKGSPFEKPFTLSILKLREEGYMDFLNERWFINNCPDSRMGNEEHQMDINNLAGVFLCYVGGLTVALLFVAVLWIREKTKSEKKIVVSPNSDRSFIS
ncbi:glutamate receptor ionotropic, kainate 2-like [Centruroides vittatus]|uniref:glutamate receptor ionotropic, kainate 2-like n=1 Tax=Centruroides vittatus TaxID=120091 RepID=UPI0035103222